MSSSSPFSLKDKTILLTGASSGIGRQTCISIANMGANVILTARNQEKLQETLSKMKGNNHQIILADLTDDAQLNNLVEQLPKLDGLVHCAGIVIVRPIRFLDKKELQDMLDINYLAPSLLSNAVLKKRLMNKGGAFVFISSLGSSQPYFGGSGYSGSKGAISSFSKTLALEYCKKGIRSNVISPASIKTDIFEEMEEMLDKDFIEKYAAKYPLGIGLAEDVANMVIFLLSPASKWITGMDFQMEGGLLLNR